MNKLEQSISSQQDFLVNLGQMQEKEKAPPMSVTSGLKLFPLLKAFDLGGSLERMCEVLLAKNWDSPVASMTWKALTTKHKDFLFQLRVSAPTAEKGSGLWATPQGRDHRGAHSQEYIANQRAKGHGCRNLNDEVVIWPTPSGQDNNQVRGIGKTVGTKRGTTLGGGSSNVAYTSEARLQEWETQDPEHEGENGGSFTKRSFGGKLKRRLGGVAYGISNWMDEPRIPRTTTKQPDRVNRIKALGNSIVPQIVAELGSAILVSEKIK